MTETHAQALRAVGRITLTFGLFGCIEEVADPGPEVEVQEGTEESEADDTADGTADAAIDAPDGQPTGQPDGALFVDAEGSPEGPDAEVSAGDGGVADASATTDRGPTTDAGVICDRLMPSWAECCEAQNWNPDAGCLAWGPPVPPALA